MPALSTVTISRLLGAGTTLASLALVTGCREPNTANGGSPRAADAAQAAEVTTPSAATAPAQATVLVQRETLRRYAPAVGNLRARQTTTIGPQVSGRVEKVLVDVGDRVRKDQLLVQLDPVSFEIQVGQSTAAVAAARGALEYAAVDVANAQREMQRQLGLFEQGVGTTKERDDAVTAHERALATRTEKQARLAEAEKQLEWAQRQLAETRILAPYDGAITARLVDPGQPATTMPPTRLVEIQEVGMLYLEFALPQELRNIVCAGTPLKFDVEGVAGGTEFGTVAVVFPAIDELTRSFRCRALIDNAAGQYQPGSLASVSVVTREIPGALVIPRTCLSQAAAGWQTQVLTEGRPTTRPVAVGLVADDKVEILSGLTEGEQVITGVTGPP